ncbi:MAG: ribonuclease P protein component [Ruminococcaceae bacterium]|nr:ribonuclease P protein component [Oscillospiraceae bacterium]
MKDIAITENHLYQKAFRRGQRWSGRFVTVCVLKDLHAKRLMKENPQKKYLNRIGLSVPKREGGAVERNRVKRILRAGLAEVRKKNTLKTGYLIVISTRPGVEKQKSTAIAAELQYIFKKLDMFVPSPGISNRTERETPQNTP